MVLYLLKRLLLILPALWLIVTLVFLLSKALPGTSGSEKILQSTGYYATGSATARAAAYQDYLNRTGQQLPLFYFGISASVEPDTLYKITPETDRKLLQTLIWNYGNWPSVASYYTSIKQLRQRVSEPEQHLIAPLFSATDKEAILAATGKLDQLKNTPETGALVTEVKLEAKALAQLQPAYGFLLPTLRWYGTNNQYHRWMKNLIKGDLGNSYRDSKPVSEKISEAVTSTFWILIISIAAAFLIAFEVSILLVQRQETKLQKALMSLLYFLDSIPLFVLSLLLMVLLASPVFLQLLPVFGLGYFETAQQNWLQVLMQQLPYLALPILCLTTAYLPYLTNQLYRALADTSHTDYARTARAKGLSARKVIRKHLLRNALLPVITLLSDFLPALVAGTIVIETIFAIPGIGRLLVESVQARDYPVLVAIVLLVAVFKMLSHLLADVLYSKADPRIRLSSAR